MNDLLKKLSEPLTADQIDFRVQSINKGGYATILAYKDARVDINRLNDVCGMNWERKHNNGNHNCVVSIYDAENKHWVSREDTGTESNTEAAKGLASDSFKRACFNWGIGIELYDYPVIQVKLNQDEFKVENNRAKQTWNLRLKEWKWRVDCVGRKVTYIAAKDQNGDFRFSWGSATQKALEENYDNAKAVYDFLEAGDVPAAAECWYAMPPNARRDLYVAEKHGGPYSPAMRTTMKEEFQEYFPGDDWNEGLFSRC